MKKTELVQFKEEYESAVRNVDEIINNPYTAILLKYKKAEESNYCIKFRQYALRYWGQLHGVDFSEFGDKDITVDEFNHALSMAQIEKKTDFEGGGGNAENNIIDQIKRRLNVILFGVVKPEDDRKIKIDKRAMLTASNIVFFDELLKIDVGDTDSNNSTQTATRSDRKVVSTNGMDTYSELSGEISVDVNSYEFGEMLESTKEYYLSYGSDFKTAWLNTMYTDVYEYSGKYSNQVAWERFTEYMVFYDEVVDYNNELALAPALYDVYYAYDPATEEEAALCVDDVIQIAEENGAQIQF